MGEKYVKKGISSRSDSRADIDPTAQTLHRVRPTHVGRLSYALVYYREDGEKALVIDVRDELPHPLSCANGTASCVSCNGTCVLLLVLVE
ncbi:hypothetical protein [Ktedonospora formicarum]|uniref:hypothetical protein n=1 Tax=Ktedonospora formicarum TaxID=2778364 RepID=UPI001C691770|nr:hypothetical protein [Ktedonospora formicarum]